ncbi:MAG: hypothetical protein H0V89_03305 [Deltaproteobacteria bacterium]|nr:hypothetical protein [Deltaproteobacteria bacterium]
MSASSLVAGGMAALVFVSGIAGLGAWALWYRPKQTPGVVVSRTDPDREARDGDRREQQRLLAALSKSLAPREGVTGRWSPRSTNPITGRAVLLFDNWRPLNAEGKRLTRRRGPEALLVGKRWPFILSVDLTGLGGPEAARVAEEVIAQVRSLPGTRARLVTGPPGPIRQRVERIVSADGCDWSSSEEGFDLSTDGSPV